MQCREPARATCAIAVAHQRVFVRPADGITDSEEGDRKAAGIGGGASSAPGSPAVTTVVTLTNTSGPSQPSQPLPLQHVPPCRRKVASSPGPMGLVLWEVDLTIQDSAQPEHCVYPANDAPCGSPTSAATLSGFASHSWSIPAIPANSSAALSLRLHLDPSASDSGQGMTASAPTVWGPPS